MSLRLLVLSFFTRLVVKRWLGLVTEVPKLRKSFARHAERTHWSPPLSDYRNGMLKGASADVPVKWVARGARRSDDILFYVHGGGFVSGSPDTHKHMVAYICGELGLEAVMPRYRLAPEHPFPAGFDDVVACYQALVMSGRDPRRIILGGDSAGGGLVLSLLAYISANNLPLPMCAFAMCPAVDFTGSGGSRVQNAKSDVVFNPRRFSELREMYLGDQDPKQPYASPLFARFKTCPPVLMQVADGEILRDDTLMMQNHLLEQGAEVLVRSWSNAFHVWHLMLGFLPEAQDALDDIVRFISAHQVAAETSL